MDAVPLEFSERVAATWKCCESVRCRCVTPVFSTRKWTFPKATNATFVVFPDARGEWVYNFYLGSGVDMTMSELLEHPDFKNLQIDYIRTYNILDTEKMKPVSDVGMEKLLKIVSFLANEPRVFLTSRTASNFSSPEGVILLKWIEQRWFSYIFFLTYHSAFNRLLQKQTSRRIPTDSFVRGVIGDAQFFAAQLRSGQMTRFGTTRCVFSSDVMEGIVQSFLRSPSEKKVDVCARFDDTTEGRLMEMEEGGLCRRVDGKFIFENPFHRLEVSNLYPSSASSASVWKCVTVKSEGLSDSVVLKQSSALKGRKVTTWLLRSMAMLLQKLLLF